MIMNFLSKLFKKIKENMRASKKECVERRANELFQIREYDSKLWYTYNGALFCPCSMVGDEKDYVPFLITLRKLYVERNEQ